MTKKSSFNNILTDQFCKKKYFIPFFKEEEEEKEKKKVANLDLEEEKLKILIRGIAQLVERFLCKADAKEKNAGTRK